VRYGLVLPRPAPEEWRGWYEAIEDLLETLPESEFAPWQMRRLCSIGGIHETMMVDSAGFPDDTGGPRVPVMRGAAEPVNTVVANYGRRPMRAFLVGGQYGKPAGSDGLRPPQTAWSGEPAFTVTAVNKGDWRAWLERGRVVQMTPRALARFQTFPDWYELPDTNTLAARVVGNAVPARMYQKIAGQLVSSSAS
jgi:DNA (cytosine-5)-methyltransferase 1